MKSPLWAIALLIVGLALLSLSFMDGTSTSMVSPAETRSDSPTVLADQGRALFLAKGCASCHDRQIGGAPNLVVYKPETAFLRQWLRDPTAIRPETYMPNLHLSDDEIEALIAYLKVKSSP